MKKNQKSEMQSASELKKEIQCACSHHTHNKIVVAKTEAGDQAGVAETGAVGLGPPSSAPPLALPLPLPALPPFP